MGSVWMDVPSESRGSLKATTGATDANGGYLAPRNVVADFNTVGVATNPYRSLLTVVTGIQSNVIDIPHIGLAPSRATVIARGETKTNVDVSMSQYTATFYTLAQIHDAANQWLRQTGGQGERLIRQRLGQAIALGESYYILSGSGTSQPKGLLTSLGTSGTFVTSHTAANNTIAGNAATAIAKAAGVIANRSRIADGVVMNAGDFWTFMAQGADAAGFYIAPTGGAASVNAVGAFSNGAPAMRIWGLPVYADANMPADSLVVGAWREAELYVGADYRVDTSSEAGDRWDKNLTGFRAEEDIAFNADPYVAAGMFQRIIDAVA
jgi:HK97 family phage major capsid protein